jgi:hypothetical protein
VTVEQILAVVAIYEEGLSSIEPRAADYKRRYPTQRESLEHAKYMCTQIVVLVQNQNLDKAQRWLGFLQAILWTSGIYSIDDMRNHNR